MDEYQIFFARSARKGSHDLWRLRVGAYRVVYSVDDQQKVVDVVAIRHRRDAYR